MGIECWDAISKNLYDFKTDYSYILATHTLLTCYNIDNIDSVTESILSMVITIVSDHHWPLLFSCSCLVHLSWLEVAVNMYAPDAPPDACH